MSATEWPNVNFISLDITCSSSWPMSTRFQLTASTSARARASACDALTISS